jgi:hypothetical protein
MTLEEWIQYVDGLSDEDLVRKGKALNSMEGVKVLQKTLTADEIADLLAVVAVTFEERDMALPHGYDGEYLNLETMLEV